MLKGEFKYLAITLLVIALLLPVLLGCVGREKQEIELEPVISLPQLNFELEDLLGEKVWVPGFYGDDRFTGDGVGFLVADFYMLMVKEKTAGLFICQA